MNKKQLPLIFSVVVFLSGIAGLSYELIWIRTIKGYFGSEIFSVSLVVSLYFAGLGLGGLIGSRILKRGFSALKTYAAVEAGLAVFALLFPQLIRLDHQLYLALAAMLPSALWMMLKAFLIAILLIVPTTLIGITLPLIAAVVVDQAKAFTTSFSRFYGINTFGAVTGCLLTGFVFVPHFGLVWAGTAAALFNGLAALMCLMIGREKIVLPGDVYHEQPWKTAVFPGLIAFLMGFLSLIYEVVWIRIFGFYFVSSTASLALLLCIFLAGLALGSALLSLWKKPVSVGQLAVIELVKACIMIVSFLLVRHVFYNGWSAMVQRYGMNPDFGQLTTAYLIFGGLAFFFPALLMGMTFPLLERVWLATRAGSAHVVGVMSAWNTWGGTMGAAAAGLVFISAIGSVPTLFIAIACSVLAAVLLLVHIQKTLWGIVPVVVIAVLFYWLPKEMNYMRKPRNLKSYDYYHEGRSGSVAIIKNQFGEKTLYVGNAYVLGGTSFQGVRIQQRQGALPNIIVSKDSRKCLKIGLGTGITLDGLADCDGIQQVDVVEIVPEVIKTLNHFAPDNHAVYRKPDVRIHEGDGREFLATSNAKYDVILGELYTPQYAGTGNLYSIEHLQAVKSHLAPEGVFCQWIQMSQFSHETFKIVVNTFLQVFGNGSLWIVNTDVQKPVAALVSSTHRPCSPQSLQDGLAMYSAESRDVLSWGYSVDVAAHFVTDNLWQVAESETRVNTVNHPWIEEMAPRHMASPDESPLVWIRRYRHWPDVWSQWQAGYTVWSAYGRAQELALELFMMKETDPEFIRSVESTLRALPKTRTINAYQAEILMNLIDKVIDKKQMAMDQNIRVRTVIPFTEAAVAADPGNYAYRYNLLLLYRSIGDMEKFEKAMSEFWSMLPEHLKYAPVFRGMGKMVKGQASGNPD
ncbi:fused MFS/spermidine synthase [bacterium]|nr:fused MFS/spermidine synthase [bacterium]